MSKNLRNRILTGLCLSCIALACIWVGGLLVPLLLIIFITFATNEFLRFLHRKDIYPHTVAIFLPAYAIPLLLYAQVPLVLPLAILFLFICILSVMRFPGARYKPNFLSEVTSTVFAVLYLSLLPSTLIPLRRMGFIYALMPIFLTAVYDISAYIAGSSLGKHKLAPGISPSKTWEGSVIALIVTFLVLFIMNKYWIPLFALRDVCLIALGIGILDTMGDLFESAMKREVNLKDASKIFPGHGGFLDRMDSLLFTVPFYYLYLIFIQ